MKEKILILQAILLLASCSSIKEEKLIHIGQMIVDDNLETLQRYDSLHRTYCHGEITPYYLLIQKEREFDHFELYGAHLTEMGETVDIIRKYKGRIIALRHTDTKEGLQLPSDTCGWIIIDERDWLILYDTRHDRYVAVEAMGMPLEIILQINQRDWNDSIKEAIEDTSFNYTIPDEPLE